MEMLNLTWDVYTENSCNTIRNLYTDTTFTDVTLLTEDDQQISAHKVVLASGSCFFRRILMKNFHQNPLIYLKGIKFSDLKSIVRFIYLGETEIHRNEVEGFMRTGKDLQINGLLESIKTSDKNRNKKKSVHFKLEDEKEEETFVTNSETDTDMSIESDLESSIEGPEVRTETNQETGREAGSLGGPSLAKHHCDTCNQSYSRQDNLQRHKRIAHGELLI